MKINKIFYIIILFVVLLMFGCPRVCYADQIRAPGSETGVAPEGETQENASNLQGNSSGGLPNLKDSGYKPKVTLGVAAVIFSRILGFLTVIGILVTVVGIALIGFGSILGSAGEKAEAQTKLVGIVIAAIVITSGSAIANLIISVAESIA